VKPATRKAGEKVFGVNGGKTQQNSPVLEVENLSVCFQAAGAKAVSRLLNGISFTLREQDVLGLVGETGSGKSILIDAVGRNPKPPLWVEADTLAICSEENSTDLLQVDDEALRKIWGNKIAFIPANARDKLNPVLRVGRQVCNVIQANLGLSAEEARAKVLEMFKLVHLPAPTQNFRNYPHELSGGMAQRIVISMALASDPRLLLADEPTMGLDVTIQAQVLDLMAELTGEIQSAVILATRDLGIVANYCNRVAVVGCGELVEIAEIRDFFERAVHPYSRYLLAAAFASHGRAVDLELEVSRPPMVGGPHLWEAGCRFVDRCQIAMDRCRESPPSVRILSDTHQVKCHKAGEL
jgi:oligopeptide/dipeptide ABC transporter ATP-binding protein